MMAGAVVEGHRAACVGIGNMVTDATGLDRCRNLTGRYAGPVDPLVGCSAGDN